MLSYADIGAAAMLTRATAGVANGKVIISLPGSTGAVELGMTKLVLPELGHMLFLLRVGTPCTLSSAFLPRSESGWAAVKTVVRCLKAQRSERSWETLKQEQPALVEVERSLAFAVARNTLMAIIRYAITMSWPLSHR